jgi:hypothetical protein
VPGVAPVPSSWSPQPGIVIRTIGRARKVPPSLRLPQPTFGCAEMAEMGGSAATVQRTRKGGLRMTERRWLALCGVVAALLIPVAFVAVAGKTPNDKASADKVVSFTAAT